MIAISEGLSAQTTKKAAAYEKAAELAYHSGESISDIVRLREISELAYKQIGQLPESNRVRLKTTSLINEVGSSPAWRVPSLTTLTSKEVLDIIEKRNLNISDVARQYYLEDRFDKAAQLYSESAKESVEPSVRLQLALQAFYASGAAGQIEEARTIVKEFKSIEKAVKQECAACLFLGNSHLLDKVRVLTADRAIFSTIENQR
jgi:hypothetical protein